MGVTYKPTIRYKIFSHDKNILKNPELDLVMPQVNSNRNSRKSKSPYSPRVDIGLLDSPLGPLRRSPKILEEEELLVSEKSKQSKNIRSKTSLSAARKEKISNYLN